MIIKRTPNERLAYLQGARAGIELVIDRLSEQIEKNEQFNFVSDLHGPQDQALSIIEAVEKAYENAGWLE